MPRCVYIHPRHADMYRSATEGDIFSWIQRMLKTESISVYMYDTMNRVFEFWYDDSGDSFGMLNVHATKLATVEIHGPVLVLERVRDTSTMYEADYTDFPPNDSTESLETYVRRVCSG